MHEDRKKIDTYYEYCTGCGLCHSEKGVEFFKTQDGFIWPQIDSDSLEFYKQICPASGEALKRQNPDEIWGNYTSYKYGYSLDEDVRLRSSSGGILTSLLVYLLESRKIDAVIQTKADEKTPYTTITVINKEKGEVLSSMGSRYTSSSPLYNIVEIVESDKKYAFVGKPCDVSALKLYAEKYNHKIKNSIIFYFSFFCAGIPSENAQEKLLEHLGCSIEECRELQYRGNGWPGLTTCVSVNGMTTQTNYEDSWGKILGRDVRRSCRFCVDGIGEMADISVGDAWYLTEDLKPDFSENEGRNLIFVRSDTGKNLIEEAINKKIIYAENADIKELAYIQKYQFDRRTTMFGRIMAMKLLGRKTPNYSFKSLIALAKHGSVKKIFSSFTGTIKRVKSGRI